MLDNLLPPWYYIVDDGWMSTSWENPVASGQNKFAKGETV
jgi:hypothetical protein